MTLFRNLRTLILDTDSLYRGHTTDPVKPRNEIITAFVWHVFWHAQKPP